MRKRRAGGLLVGCGAFLVAAAAWAPPLPTGGCTAWWLWWRADPQRGLALLAGGVGWLLAAWLFLVTALALLATSAHGLGRIAGRAGELLTPRIARGVLEALLGAALAVGSAGPALAGGAAPAVTVATSPSLAPVPAPVVAAPVLPGLLDLDRPGVSWPVIAPAKQRPVLTHPVSYRVRPGDTLWGLAAARLPAHSSTERITRGWQEWYLVNRQQIGADPGMLLVGETLVVPRVLS